MFCMNKCVQLIEEINKNRNITIELDSPRYIHYKEDNIKGYMIGNVYYSIEEYNKLLELENDSIEKRIKELDKICFI